MASAIFSYLKNAWPFHLLRDDDLKASNRLVKRLAIPEQTKQFVFAIPDSDSRAVVYILAAQNLSEQSAIDADHLIKEVRPNAVVVSVAPSALPEIQVEEKCSCENQVNHIPTSSFGVLSKCLFEKIKKEQYDSFAGCQVLQAIFGIGFYGHFLSAKRAAESVDSHFLLLESPYENSSSDSSTCSDSVNESSRLHLQTNSLLPGKVTPSMSSSSKSLFVSGALQSDMVKSLIPSLDLLVSTLIVDPIAEQVEEGILSSTYQIPPFAQSVYSLLVDLHHIFKDLPAIGKALSSAQKMLLDVNEGEPVDTKTLSTVQNFRIAIEGLRIALNKTARRPITELDATNSNLLEFNNLPTEEKCHVLFAQALKKQVRNFGAVVAIVDAASVAGLRKHWNTSVPPEVTDLANHCVIHHCNDHDSGEEIMNDNHEKKKTLTDKPVVALGAGATALVGVSSFSKAMPASSLIKAASLHASSSFKIGLLQLQRKVAFGLSKLLFPSKLVAPGLTTGTKLTASAEKIRAVTHTMIAAAERTSLSAIRTSFYEIMRKRNVRPVGYTPWVSFACSMGACAGLLTYGDGIECAAESVPSVSMIASLGRGLQSLKQASQEVKETSGVKDPSSDAMYPSVGNRSYSVFFLGLALLFFFIKNPPSFLQDIAQQQTPESLYDITVKDISGSNVSLSTYSGKVLLIVNVASKCGLTHKNYNEMNILYEKYKDKGLEILAFPCNQFLSQEPGSNEEIQEAACTILKAEFPIFDKVEVNGKNVAPLYKFLKSKKGGFFGDSIKWNFTKFLIDRQGNVVQRYAPTTSPMKIEEDIQKLL